MSASATAVMVIVGLALGVWPWFVVRRYYRQRAAWAPTLPDGSKPSWWKEPIRPTMLRPSITVAGDPAPAVLVEERDPRIVTGPKKRDRKKPTGHQRKAVSA